MDGAPIGNDEGFGPQRLEADIIAAARDRAFDAGGEQLLEGCEQHALQLNGQSEQAIEEGRDRRQLVLHAVLIHQAQARRLLELL